MTAPCSFAMCPRLAKGWLTAALILRRRVVPAVITLAAFVVANVVSSEAMARGRSHNRGRSSAAAAAARKKQTIQTIQNQVATARQVLAAAESQAAMSEKELSVVRERIAAARSEIEAAGSAEREAIAELRELESDIVEAQGADSPLGKAQAAIDDAQVSLDWELHRVLSLPGHTGTPTAADRSAEARSLSATQRDALRKDVEYQLALERVASAKRNLAQIREDVFKRNPEWVAASKAVTEAHKKESKAKQDGSIGAIRSMPAKRDLRTSQDVAAAARATIAQGEAMLRQLGVKNAGGASKPKK